MTSIHIWPRYAFFIFLPTLSDPRQTLLAAQIATYFALGLSKTATVLIVRRLFTVDMREPRRTCNIVTGIVVIWTIVSALLISVGCSAASISPRSLLETCPGMRTRYLIVTITDALTDIILTVTPTYLCCRLNMGLCIKLQVLGIFGLRLPLILLSILFFKYWKHSLDNANPGIARTTPLAYQQCQLCISIIVGTIPSLKAFLQSFDTGSGVKADLRCISNANGNGGEESSARCGRQSSSSGQWDSYQMERLDRSCFHISRQQLGRDDGAVRIHRKPCFGMDQRRESVGKSSKYRHTISDESDRRSNRSTQELVIRKDMQWEVKSEIVQTGSDVDTPGLLRLPM
jgi:hypothetical protein